MKIADIEQQSKPAVKAFTSNAFGAIGIPANL